MSNYNTPAFVYLIKSESGYVKIGVSIKPISRLSQLQTSSPYKLTFHITIECQSDEAAYKLEETLHEMYDEYRVSGEWFAVDVNRITTDIENCLKIASAIKGMTSYRRVLNSESQYELEQLKLQGERFADFVTGRIAHMYQIYNQTMTLSAILLGIIFSIWQTGLF